MNRNLAPTCRHLAFVVAVVAFVVTLNPQYLHTQNPRKFVTFSSIKGFVIMCQ